MGKATDCVGRLQHTFDCPFAIFLQNGPTSASLLFIFGLFKQQHNFYIKSMLKMNNLVCGFARIRTCDLVNISLLFYLAFHFGSSLQGLEPKGLESFNPKYS